MAHLKKKFTFDDPQDSYWNESGSNSSSLFDDLPSKQWAARAALDNLFESAETPKARPVLSGAPDAHTGGGDAAVKLASAPTQARDKIVDEFINNRTSALKIDNTSSPNKAPSVVSECSISSLPSDAHRLDLDYSRLRAEHRKLQRHLETVRHDRFRALDVTETVRRLLRGDPVSLEFYRSKNDKAALLDAALVCVDDNTIHTVLLFLKQTLSDSIFRDMLLRKKEAADQYVSYLKMIKDTDELITTLFALGRNADAAMAEFSAAIRQKIPEQKVQSLRKCTQSAFSDPLLAAEASIVNDYVSLLERQIPIEKADEHSRSAIFQNYPKNGSLVGQSAVSTLYYSCLYHYDLPANSLASPGSLRDCLRLSEKEFAWTCVSALVRQSRWPDVERVLQPKSIMGALQNRGLLGSVKLNCPFSWQNLFLILHTNTSQPPKDFSCRILRAVSDQELRLKLAEKYEVSEIVIEGLLAQRDRLKLSKYSATLTPHTPESYKALAVLNNTTTKWKN